MTTLEKMEAAKAFLTPENWSKGFYAHNANGEQTDWESEEAATFCLIGAYYKVNNYSRKDMFSPHTRISILSNITAKRGYLSLAVFNDHGDTKFEDVVSLLDEAITICKAPDYVD
jgi:hypothetical protein